MADKSIATIAAPEFINLQPMDINPLMSSCEIKVLYIGENRNKSYISKEAAIEISKTLRGAPIVGYFKKIKDDFRDHGNRLVIEENQVKKECLTVPYGFVSPNADVWFQKFTEIDDFGNEIEREYLMTTGFLWTGQFEEAKKVFEEDGRPQSMELDEETLDGKWAENYKTGIEYFIINDAVISKLCILGKDVEPCFEGANIKAPEISSSFSLGEDFVKSFVNMVKELKFALEGGQEMEQEQANVSLEESVQEEENKIQEENLDNSNEVIVEENENSIESSSEETVEFKKDESEDEKEEKEDEDKKEEPSEKESESEADEKEKKEKYVLEEEYNSLNSKFEKLNSDYSLLKEEYDKLVEFKNEIENKEKDALINKFYMLSDEDKADVVNNKANYSLDEIEAKLSVICVRKKVSFSEEEEKDASKQLIYSLEEECEVPAWVTAIRNNRKSN